MTTTSNRLRRFAFSSSPVFQWALSSSLPLEVSVMTSPILQFDVHRAGVTPKPRNLEAISVLGVPGGSEVGEWRLKTFQLIRVRRTRKEFVATTWLEGGALVEYGSGKTAGEAITDLVTSLGEYREALEERESKVGDSSLKELAHLRNIIERTTNG